MMCFEMVSNLRASGLSRELNTLCFMRIAYSGVISTAEYMQSVQGELDDMNSLLVSFELPKESPAVSCKDLHEGSHHSGQRYDKS